MQKLLITRPLPETVLTAARARFDVTLRDSTAPLTDHELRAALRDFDAVLPTLGDRFQADVFADTPTPRAKILANFGVVFNHIHSVPARPPPPPPPVARKARPRRGRRRTAGPQRRMARLASRANARHACNGSHR